ncbi:hypothetical protein jhhlp_001740 [Lomentospora prolificans]|uniref:Uncharacterized protein n=1 Tax=Lomentospora prolificans TaxID=41688 RepID=A0A2N3NH81_9PEZI|nr:hypothetical protein jhhlp_001740 [Lomentospora prolificans]
MAQALRLPYKLLATFAIAFFALVSPVLSVTIEHDFSIGWVTANPDGAFDRPTIGVNGEWPIPLIRATVGDTLNLKVTNDLGNASTSLHFHGLFQNGTNHMDGAVGIAQCPIPPGESFTYNFKFEQPGTYWYHAHNDGQYPEGLRGPVVVHDPNGPYEGYYDEEIVITFSDWYHRPIPDLVADFISFRNPTGAEPVPQAALMNDTQNLHVKVEPNKTYLIRMVNMGAFAAHYIWFEDHVMRIVEVDGVWTEEAEANMIYMTPAQRYSVLLTTKNETDKNFAIVGAMDQDLFDVIPDGLNPNVTGWLVYDEDKPLPEPLALGELDAFDDFNLVPKDGEELFENVDYSLQLDVKMDNLGDGANYAFFNDITYVGPKVPSLYTALTVGSENSTNPQVYGSHTSSYVLGHNQVIEIVLNNADPGKHPFHLHGHNFQVVHRSEEEAGVFVNDNSISLPKVPMRRDTLFVQPNGNFVIRYRSDNPGVWLFHCHIEWHMLQDALQGLELPEDHLNACKAAGIPTSGNAAGNTQDVFDLAGENTSVEPLPSGFTAKGYVAMVFSCLAAILGIIVISWYVLHLAGPHQT